MPVVFGGPVGDVGPVGDLADPPGGEGVYGARDAVGLFEDPGAGGGERGERVGVRAAKRKETLVRIPDDDCGVGVRCPSLGERQFEP